MKKIIYSSVVLVLITSVVFILWRPKEEASAEPKQQESLEQKAYRVETTPRKPPKNYDEISQEIWRLEEKNRIGQAKVRIKHQMGSEMFRRKWQEYKQNHRAVYERLSELRMIQGEQADGKLITTLFGGNSDQYKKYSALLEKKRNKEISQRDYQIKVRKLTKTIK